MWGSCPGSYGAPGAGGRWANPRAKHAGGPLTWAWAQGGGPGHIKGLASCFGEQTACHGKAGEVQSQGEMLLLQWRGVQQFTHSKPVCAPALGQWDADVLNRFQSLRRSCSWSVGPGGAETFCLMLTE